MSNLAEFFETAKLPIMTEVAHSLVRTLNDPDANAAQIEAIISKDPALTANLLRMANTMAAPHEIARLCSVIAAGIELHPSSGRVIDP